MRGSKRRLIIVSGLSGAGKSQVLNTLEDLDFYCIDNLPLGLFNQLAGLLSDADNNFPAHVGVGIDARSPEHDLSPLPDSIKALLDTGVAVELVFLEANKNVLTSRFGETRRKHPLSSNSVPLTDAIDLERRLMERLSELADLRIDTSHTSVHELRDIIRQRLANRPVGSLSLQFISFGYKYGVPRDADFVFDVRCLPNPYWRPELRDLTGRDQAVCAYLAGQPAVADMHTEIRNFLEKWLPAFEAENRSYLGVAIGCTGGRHRSVYIVEELSKHFTNMGKYIVIRHRDL
ncbi:MAG: Nucleotide-binding protein A3J35 [Gammaproteobacteria bacterium]|nr:Nucleotide-binding protein A3J35 [Gammaproteobacteria bacterium]